jgi:hypothetical protein
MVTNYPHLVTPDSGFTPAHANGHVQQEEEGIGGRVLDWMRQSLCGLHGHDALLQFQHDRMFLKCVSCGHETPGWELNEAPPIVRVYPEEAHRPQVRPQLIGARRIA